LQDPTCTDRDTDANRRGANTKPAKANCYTVDPQHRILAARMSKRRGSHADQRLTGEALSARQQREDVSTRTRRSPSLEDERYFAAINMSLQLSGADVVDGTGKICGGEWQAAPGTVAYRRATMWSAGGCDGAGAGAVVAVS
jgi:hypothetical protein